MPVNEGMEWIRRKPGGLRCCCRSGKEESSSKASSSLAEMDRMLAEIQVGIFCRWIVENNDEDTGDRGIVDRGWDRETRLEETDPGEPGHAGAHRLSFSLSRKETAILTSLACLRCGCCCFEQPFSSIRSCEAVRIRLDPLEELALEMDRVCIALSLSCDGMLVTSMTAGGSSPFNWSALVMAEQVRAAELVRSAAGTDLGADSRSVSDHVVDSLVAVVLTPENSVTADRSKATTLDLFRFLDLLFFFLLAQQIRLVLILANSRVFNGRSTTAASSA